MEKRATEIHASLLKRLIPFVVFTFFAAAFTSRPAAADTPVPIQSAQQQFKAGNFPAAVLSLQNFIAQNPSNAEALFWLGRCYYEERDYDNAIAQDAKAVALEPKNSAYHDWLGREYGGKADRDHSFSSARSVKKEFETAVSLNSSNIDARRDLEQYDLEAPWIVGGDKDEALEQVNAVAALDPIQGHLARGEYYQNQKRMDQAATEYEQVSMAPSATVDELLEVAGFFEQQNTPSAAASATSAAAKISPNEPRLTFHRGVDAVLSDGDASAAEQNLKSYIASTPDRTDWPSHAAAREWLGRLYEREGKTTEAAEQYRDALQLDPSRKEAKQRLQKLSKGS